MKTDLINVKFQQIRNNRSKMVEGDMIAESPVALYVNGELWLTFMCTPNNIDALAVGFLYNEAVIETYTEVLDLHICDNWDIIDIWLNHNIQKPKEWKRTSGCTGGYTSADLYSVKPVLIDGTTLESKQVHKLVDTLLGAQNLYSKAGGVHTSVLTDGESVTVMAEDVGRHNSLDKIAGKCLLEGIALSKKILLTTGRISSDMLQKAARIGASIVISRTSPTSLSIELAEKWGLTLIGYARRDRFNIYTHPGRIILPRLQEVYHAKKSASP